MSMKQVFLALALVTILGVAAPCSQAQVVGGGGYVGFGAPGIGGAVSFGTPVVGAPLVPYAAPYPVVVPRPVYGVPFYGAGWGGYGPRYYGPRYYRRGYGYRRW